MSYGNFRVWNLLSLACNWSVKPISGKNLFYHPIQKRIKLADFPVMNVKNIQNIDYFETAQMY